jgi:hypothetical protein
MRAPEGDAPSRRVESPSDRQRWLARGCNEMAVAALHEPEPSRQVRLESLAGRYAAALGRSPGELTQAVVTARRKLNDLADAMGLRLAPQATAQELTAVSRRATEAMASPAAEPTAPTLVLDRSDAPVVALSASEVLTAGIQDITQTLAQDSFRLNEVLRMIMETIYRALGFRCVVFALKDPRSAVLTGRFGLGDGAQALAAQFSVALQGSTGAAPDLLSAVCQRGVDTLIADASATNVATRLPPWLRRESQARTFLLLPLAMKGATFALIYADRSQPGSIAAAEKELSLLRTLRNQALMAFRQVG